jgi:ankyrin repeat protein
VVEVLLAAGAAFNPRSNTLLTAAAQGGSVLLLERILAEYSPPKRLWLGAVRAAAVEGQAAALQALLAYDPREPGATADLMVPLSIALRKGHRAAAEALLAADSALLRPEADADGVLRDRVHEFRRTVLMDAAEGGCVDIAARAMAQCVDVNARDQMTCTALVYASDPATVRMLLDAKADADPGSNVPVLNSACHRLQPAAVRMLLDAGARVDGCAGRALLPIQTVLSTECSDDKVDDKVAVINMLFDAGADKPSAWGTASPLTLEVKLLADPSTRRVVAALLARDRGLLEARDADGSTPLMVAVAAANPALVEVLLDARADVHALDREGKSVLTAAVSGPRVPTTARVPQVLQLLLDAGADPLQLCANGWTAAMAAVEMPEHQTRGLAVGIFGAGFQGRHTAFNGGQGGVGGFALGVGGPGAGNGVGGVGAGGGFVFGGGARFGGNLAVGCGGFEAGSGSVSGFHGGALGPPICDRVTALMLEDLADAVLTRPG